MKLKGIDEIMVAVCSIFLLTALSSSATTIAQTNSNPGSTAPLPQVNPTPPAPDANLSPINGKVTVNLVNTTGTQVTYQLLGITSPQALQGRSQVSLPALATPVNLNFFRPDRGFLIVRLQTVTPNTLQLTLTETDNQDLGRTSLVVNPKGEVFLY
jgi:hypothetical protein